MQSYFYGHDYGNSTVASVLLTEQGQRRGAQVFPSLSAPGNLAQLERLRSSLNAPIIQEGESVLTFRERETFHGTLAFEARDATAYRGDATRYWSEGSLRALLVASAGILADEDYELFVVTGLPIETYDKHNRSLVKRALEGEHAFVYNQRPRRARIHVSQVIMEGAGALIAYGMSSPDVKQGAIDIGGQTTDLFATKGQMPRIELCRGKPVGVERAMTLFNEAVAETLDGHTFSAEDTRAIFYAYANQSAYPLLYWQGSRIADGTLYGWMQQALRATALEISSFVAHTWKTNERGAGVAVDFGRVLLVGGGAHYFAPTLREMLPHVVVPGEPELANAEGYAALAREMGPRRSLQVLAS